MANTSVSGLVSGLDTASIISQLMQIEAQPQANLKSQVSDFQQQITSLQTVNSKLQSIAAKAAELAKLSSWTPVKATSTNANVTVTADPGTTPTSLTFEVGATAAGSAVSFATTGTASGTITTSGTDLTVTRDDGTTWSSSTWKGSGTLQDLANALNASGSGVQATLVSTGKTDTNGNVLYQLHVASTATGANSGFQVTSGGASVLGGVAAGKSSSANYSVTGAATSTKVTTAGLTYNVTFADGRAPVAVTTGDGTLQGVADALNASGTGLHATLAAIKQGGATAYRLEVESTDGTAFSIDPSGSTTQPFLGGVYDSAAGHDASITVHGQTIASSSNTFTDLMPGVDVTLTAGAAGSATISVANDAASLTDKVKAMVDAVNATLDDIDSLTAYKTDTSAAGILSGDATLRDVRDQLLSSVTSGVDGQSLASVGIQTDKTGHLTFDAAKFTDAYNADPSGTAAKFAGTTTYSGTGMVDLNSASWRTQAGSYTVDATAGTIDGLAATVTGSILVGASGSRVDGLSLTASAGASGTVTYHQGIAAKLEALAQRASDSTVGSVTATINGRNSSIDDMNDRIADWDVRLKTKQESLQRQYSALEVALGKLQDQASWLSGQISSLPKMG